MIECKFETGNITASLRHAVVDVLLIDGVKILLTKRALGLQEEHKWSLPGGYVDRDETVVEAIIREVHEETGYTCEVDDLFIVIDNPDRKGDDRQNISFVFLAKPIKKVGDLNSEEVSELKWFNLTDLPPEAEMAYDHFHTIWQFINSRNDILDVPE